MLRVQRSRIVLLERASARRSPGTVGGVTSPGPEPGPVVALAPSDRADSLDGVAPSTAVTKYVYVVFGVSCVSVKVVFCVTAIATDVPSRNTRYWAMPLASVDGDQLIWMDVVDVAIAVTLSGAVGGVESPVGGAGGVVTLTAAVSADSFAGEAASYARTV